MKVFIDSKENSITVFPNPVKNGVVNFQFENQAAGIYGIRLMDKNGQVVFRKQLNYVPGANVEAISLDKYIAHGIYQLEITKPDKTQLNINVIY